MHRTALLFSTLLACSSAGTPGEKADPADTSSVVDTGPGGGDGGDAGGDPGGDGTPVEYNGDVPAEALPAIDFVATNYDGSARGKADLMTNPTVMLFYPAAGTSG